MSEYSEMSTDGLIRATDEQYAYQARGHIGHEGHELVWENIFDIDKELAERGYPLYLEMDGSWESRRDRKVQDAINLVATAVLARLSSTGLPPYAATLALEDNPLDGPFSHISAAHWSRVVTAARERIKDVPKEQLRAAITLLEAESR